MNVTTQKYIVPSKKRIEGVIGNKDAIQELKHSGEHDENQKGIDEFQAVRGIFFV